MRLIIVCCALLLAAGAAVAAPPPVGGTIAVVESFPAGTPYDLPQIPNAPDVWREMIGGARRALDIETFYFSEDPQRADALDTVLTAVAAAARRGVKVRAIADRKMNATYPEICGRLGGWPGAACRLLDARALWGGVQHAKLFLVDGDEFYLGSQNWDWRALTQIRETGARVRSPRLAEALGRLFDLDWALAGGAAADSAARVAGLPAAPPVCRDRLVTTHGDTVDVALAASPPQGLPPGVPWDWPLLEATIDSARTRVRLQLLSYSPAVRGGGYWDDLDAALRRAAARGVHVEIILSNWAKRQPALSWIRSLATAPNVAVKFTNIPEAATGYIPFARVEHAKYLIADDNACWLGTSNGSRDYFRESRNVSLFVRGRPGQGVAADLAAVFATSWDGPYAEPVSPCGEYAPPRTGE
ncbi:MAG: phospholipase D-like domain-containing protein [Candidatus Krumholzibacteriia bacterium]